MIDDAELLRAFGLIGCAVNAISLTIRAARVQERHHARDVVGHAELGRRDRERRRRRGHDEIAGERDFARAAPHRCPRSSRSPAPRMPRSRAPDRHSGSSQPSGSRSVCGSSSTSCPADQTVRARLRAQDHDAHPARPELRERGDELVHQALGQRVALLRIVERNETDVVLHGGHDQRHGAELHDIGENEGNLVEWVERNGSAGPAPPHLKGGWRGAICRLCRSIIRATSRQPPIRDRRRRMPIFSTPIPAPSRARLRASRPRWRMSTSNARRPPAAGKARAPASSSRPTVISSPTATWRAARLPSK